MWPDWAIYWTLDNFLNTLATINLPKSPTFLGNFCKCVKLCKFKANIYPINLQVTSKNLQAQTTHWTHLTKLSIDYLGIPFSISSSSFAPPFLFWTWHSIFYSKCCQAETNERARYRKQSFAICKFKLEKDTYASNDHYFKGPSGLFRCRKSFSLNRISFYFLLLLSMICS